MASIQETLYAALTSDATMSGLVADRIYPGQIPDDEATPPWLYYAVPESVPFDELADDVVEVQSQVEFHALADTYASAKAIIDAVFGVLDAYAGGLIRRAFWKGTSEESTEQGYHHAARFDVWWVQTSNSVPRSRVGSVFSAVSPAIFNGSMHGGAIDLGESAGEGLAVQDVGQFGEDGVWTGRVEQSADLVTWSPIAGATFAAVTAAGNHQVLRFSHTARHVRYAATVTGTDAVAFISVVLLQLR